MGGKIVAIDGIETSQIEALRAIAIGADNQALAEDCTRAEGGDGQAWDRCARTIERLRERSNICARLREADRVDDAPALGVALNELARLDTEHPELFALVTSKDK